MTIRFPKATRAQLQALAIPVLLNLVPGAGKYIRERLLHVPQENVADAASAASALAGAEVTVEQFRAVEQVLAAIATGRVSAG